MISRNTKKQHNSICIHRSEEIGKADFSFIDESMGVIRGDFVPNENYEKYKHRIQKHFDQKGISNIEDFNYRIVLEDNTELKPSGGLPNFILITISTHSRFT